MAAPTVPETRRRRLTWLILGFALALGLLVVLLRVAGDGPSRPAGPSGATVVTEPAITCTTWSVPDALGQRCER
jgi:hypothetical protein